MRKWTTLLMTLLVGCGSYANANMGQVSFDAGYRRDTIDWKTSFPSSDPFLKASKKFKDIDIFQIGVHGRSTIGCNFYVRGDAYWGWILDGDFTHSGKVDLNAGNRGLRRPGHVGDVLTGFSDEFRSTIDDQYVFGTSGAVGYPFFFCDCTMILAPVIGYSVDEQNVQVNNRSLNFGCLDGEYAELDVGGCCQRSFISRWYGPFVGVDFDWRPCNSCFNLWAELEYHWGHFRGKTSHLERDNTIFGYDTRNRHSNDAAAWVFSAGFDYDLCNEWTAGISVKYQDWSAQRYHKSCLDVDALTYAIDRDFCSHKVKDDNKWRSYAVNLTLGRDF